MKKIFTTRTYIKHIKRMMVMDDAKLIKLHKDHPAIVRGKKSETLLKAHNIIDNKGCVTENQHPAKKKAIEWWSKSW